MKIEQRYLKNIFRNYNEILNEKNDYFGLILGFLKKNSTSTIESTSKSEKFNSNSICFYKKKFNEHYGNEN